MSRRTCRASPWEESEGAPVKDTLWKLEAEFKSEFSKGGTPAETLTTAVWVAQTMSRMHRKARARVRGELVCVLCVSRAAPPGECNRDRNLEQFAKKTAAEALTRRGLGPTALRLFGLSVHDMTN